MTCLNVYIGRDHALIATDSEMCVGNARVPCTKVFALNHLSAIISGRGSPLTLFGAFAAACSAPDGDRFVENISKHLKDAWEGVHPFMADNPMTSEVVFVWWSASAQRMRGVHCSGFESGPCQIREIENTFNTPIFPEIDTTTMPTEPKGMARLMAQQVAGMKLHHPAEATGGRMFCTWVREGDIHTRDEGEIAHVETA